MGSFLSIGLMVLDTPVLCHLPILEVLVLVNRGQNEHHDLHVVLLIFSNFLRDEQMSLILSGSLALYL